MTRRKKLQLAALAVVVGAIGAALYFVAGRYALRAEMQRVVDGFRAAGPVPFFVAMALLPGLGFPLSAFLFAAGPVFGPTLGVVPVIAYAFLAIAVDVALYYWIAARALRPLIERLVVRFGYKLPTIPAHALIPAIFLLRVPPTPFFLQNFILGLARVPFGPYLLVTLLVQAATVIGMVTLGDAIMRGDRWLIAGAIAVLFVAGGVLHRMRKRVTLRHRSVVPPRDQRN